MSDMTNMETCMPNEPHEAESLLENVEGNEHKVDEPNTEMMFASADIMFDYYKSYGKQMGFPVNRRTSKRGEDGTLKYVTFCCGRSGKKNSEASNSLKPYPNMKIGCMARIRGCKDTDGTWRINSLTLEHNHLISPSKSRFFRCNREISSHVRRQLEVNDRAGIRVNKSYNSVVVGAGNPENVSFLEKDARNLLGKLRRLRLGEGDAMAIQNYFLKMQIENNRFFSAIDLDDKGRLRNVFWADARSREAYKEFGEVITFDTTYLTNMYDMPFAPFVGVNHHGQSTLLGCGLISSEDTNTFTWLFQTWLKCMENKAPNGIITDQDGAMKNAIEIVFPNSRHRWCLWHILKKLPAKLGRYEKYHSISFDLQSVVYDSQTPAEFEESWSKMFVKYSLQNNKWLNKLYVERRRWVPCFVKDSFWAGMSTTQRSESINAFFDGYVHSKTSLKQFVEQYGNALKNKVEKEALADSTSFSKLIPCVTTYDMELQVQAMYTMKIFKEFQGELTGKMYCEFISVREDDILSEYDVREDISIGEDGYKKRMIYRVSFCKDESDVNCSCLKFEFKGILCRHAIAVLIRNDVQLLPEKYILRRWRKDVRRSHTKVNVHYEGWNITPEQVRYDKLCSYFSKIADLAADDEEDFVSLVGLLDSKMKELSLKQQLSSRSNEPSPMSTIPTSSGNNSITIGNQLILDPIVTRGKGRPVTLIKKSQLFKKRRSKNINIQVDHIEVRQLTKNYFTK